jgi:large subunit ribosomal protein L24
MPTNKLNIKTDDDVIVIAGKDRSYQGNLRRGRVIGVLPKEQRVIVDGINVLKRAVRQTQKVRQGGIVESPGPIHVSNVMLVCPGCGKPTRVGHRRRQDGTRVRVCKQCDADIDE